MRVEVKDDYCTGNYAMVGGGQDWLEVEKLPTEDITELKAHKKLPDGTLEFDEEKYQELIAEQITQATILEKKNEISNLQKMLDDTDYQIIKCYEYSLIGEVLPYDITSLHAERQAIRDEVNIIELEIMELEV